MGPVRVLRPVHADADAHALFRDIGVMELLAAGCMHGTKHVPVRHRRHIRVLSRNPADAFGCLPMGEPKRMTCSSRSTTVPSTPHGAMAPTSHRPGDLAAVLALRRLADDADPAPPPPSACVI